MPRLRILAGPSPTDLKPISANSGKPFHVVSESFEGDVAVYIKNFADPDGEVSDSAYFDHQARKDVTWSIQMQGRFLQEYSADDILFGNVFDKPLPIPWGFSAITSFMQYIDPSLEQNLQSSTKPWALSPLISTMTYLAHRRRDEDTRSAPQFPPAEPLKEDTSNLKFQNGKEPQNASRPYGEQVRRMVFRNVEHRKSVTFGPDDVLTTDFCYNYISFSPEGVQLSLPGGFSLDLMKYWDGQPIYFVCCARASPDEIENGQPFGKVFWCVAIEVLKDEENTEGEAAELPTVPADDEVD